MKTRLRRRQQKRVKKVHRQQPRYASSGSRVCARVACGAHSCMKAQGPRCRRGCSRHKRLLSSSSNNSNRLQGGTTITSQQRRNELTGAVPPLHHHHHRQRQKRHHGGLPWKSSNHRRAEDNSSSNSRSTKAAAVLLPKECRHLLVSLLLRRPGVYHYHQQPQQPAAASWCPSAHCARTGYRRAVQMEGGAPWARRRVNSRTASKSSSALGRCTRSTFTQVSPSDGSIAPRGR